MTELDQRYLDGRYAGPGRLQRVVVAVLIVALVASGIGFVGWAVVFHSNPEVQSRLTAFTVVSEHEVQTTFTVVRSATDTQATCHLQVIAEDHTIVGAQDVPVTSGPEQQSLQLSLRTERRATSVDLLGCTAPGQPRAR